MPRRNIEGTKSNCPDARECYSILEDNDEDCHFEGSLKQRTVHTYDHDRDCHLDCTAQVRWISPEK